MNRFFFVHPDVKLTPRSVIRSVSRSSELPLLGLALGTILVVVLTLAVVWRPAPPPPHVGNTLISYELGAEGSGIYMQKHLRRTDGTLRQTLIDYSDGSKGTVNYRADSTRQDFTIVAADGTHRLESTYDKSGTTTIKGFERRPDRTLLWTTDTLTNGSLRTVNYWSDGRQPFSVSTIDSKASTYEVVYFRADGKPWARQWFKGLDAKGVLLGEDLYSAHTGLIERSLRHVAEGRGGDQVTYYRVNGTASLRLIWVSRGSHEEFYMDLDSTILFAANGDAPVLAISWSQMVPYAITVYNADGSRVVNRYAAGKPANRRVVAADGTTISDTADGADPALLAEIKPEYRAASLPEPVDPVAERQAAEAAPGPLR